MDAIIHRLRWNIKSYNQAAAVAAQKEASALSGSASFLTLLEDILVRVVPADEHVSIDKLELDLGDISKLKTAKSLQQKVLVAFENSLVEVYSKASTVADALVVKPSAQRSIEVFTQYIKTGNLPNEISKGLRTQQDVADWFVAEMKKSQRLQKQLLRLIEQDKSLQERLAKWPLNTLFSALMKAIDTEIKGADWFVEIDRQLTNSSLEARANHVESLRLLAWKFVLADQPERHNNLEKAQQNFVNESSLTSPKNKKEIAEIVKRMKKEFPNLPKATPQKRRIKEDEEVNSDSNIQTASIADFTFVRNAGLVLVSAFLPAYFERLGLLKNKNITNLPKALRALAQLDLGTNANGAADLALYKVLSGADVGVFALPDEEFSQEYAQEAEDLLSELIKHWSVLKSTKPDSLRSGFFWREGKLNESADRFDLKVEAQGQDVLLGHLPWGIGIIKLAWMQKPLYVDWA